MNPNILFLLTLEPGWACRSSSVVCTSWPPTDGPPRPGPWWRTRRSLPARRWRRGTPLSSAAPGWSARAGSVENRGWTRACRPSLGKQTLGGGREGRRFRWSRKQKKKHVSEKLINFFFFFNKWKDESVAARTGKRQKGFLETREFKRTLEHIVPEEQWFHWNGTGDQVLSVPQGTVTERNCFVAAVKVSRESLDVSLKTQLLLNQMNFYFSREKKIQIVRVDV